MQDIKKTPNQKPSQPQMHLKGSVLWSFRFVFCLSTELLFWAEKLTSAEVFWVQVPALSFPWEAAPAGAGYVLAANS